MVAHKITVGNKIHKLLKNTTLILIGQYYDLSKKIPKIIPPINLIDFSFGAVIRFTYGRSQGCGGQTGVSGSQATQFQVILL